MKNLLVVLLLVLASCQPAYAGAPAVPGEPNYRTARFPSGATAVTVDILEIGGAQLADNVAATRAQLDAANTDVWYLDISQVSGYPVNCEPKTFLLRWNPDASDCSASPALCVEETAQVGGYLCEANPKVQVSYVHASTVQSAQGINQSVMDYFNRRGQLPIRWREIRHATDLDFSSPDHTSWEVYFYLSTGDFPHLTCTVLTESDPSVSLPSSANCSGN